MYTNKIYFVTVDGVEVVNGLTMKQAVNVAQRRFDKHPEKGMLSIGIGRVFNDNGTWKQVQFPMFFYTESKLVDTSKS